MIPATSTMTAVDDLPGEEIAFTIGDPRWVMRALAKQYPVIEKAVAREYSTNAWDAHVAAGQTRPIEVTLPSALNPFFVVRDFGVGMSRETLTTTYTEFGISTKRSSNLENGMMGFGSKAAMAYTQTFSVTSVRDGWRTDAAISTDEERGIVMKAMPSTPTNEHNGTVITVPVHDSEKFAHIARDFFRFWKPGTVLVNGREPEWNVGGQLDDHLFYSQDDTSYVVLSNVAYPVNNPSVLFRRNGLNEIAFVAYVDHLSDSDGAAVEFTPNREALEYSDRTRNTLDKVVSDFAVKMKKKASDEVNNAASHFDAYVAWCDWTERLGRGVLSDLTFKGDALTHSFPIKGIRYRTSGYGYSTQSIGQWSLKDMDKTLILTDYQYTLSTRHKAMVREWAAMKNLPTTYFLFTTQTQIDSVWVDKTRVVDFETVKAELPKKVRVHPQGQSGPSRPKGKFDYWTVNRWNAVSDLPTTGDLYYIVVKDDKNFPVQNILKSLDWNDAAVVVLAINRINKFKRDNPSVKDFLAEARKQANLNPADLVPAEIVPAMNIDYDTRHWLTVLKSVMSRLDDPRWANLQSLVDRREALLAPYQKAVDFARLVQYDSHIKPFVAPGGSGATLASDYPLLSDLRHGYNINHEHLVYYMNAAWAAKKGN